MDLLANLTIGFATALVAENLLYCFVGVVLGTLIGVLPGLGPLATISMLLPITYGLPPTPALIMLAGIYYGAQYGGSTTAILLNLPGESSSVMTAVDGHQMALNGRAGPALATAALGSFFAGTVATLLVFVLSPPLAALALEFGAVEYFSLMVLALVIAILLASGSVVKALAMAVLGILLGLAGQDVNTGTFRFTFGVSGLGSGFSFLAISMGIFGLGEIIRNLRADTSRSLVASRVSGLMLTRRDWARILGPVLRGTGLGSLLGILPGGGAVLSSFVSYSVEKRVSRTPERFGRGAIEGVAGPESANNAGAQTSFIPMLTLGIPSNPVMALMIGALIIQGIQPGPNVLTARPELFWGLIASMWIGNLFLVLLNLPLIGIWVRILTVPYRFVFPAIGVFCCLGVYSANNSTFDVLSLCVFGLVGYTLIKLDCEPAPLLLGFVIGPLMEENFRRAMLIARGDWTVFLTRPFSLALIVLAVAALIATLSPRLRRTRERVFEE